MRRRPSLTVAAVAAALGLGLGSRFSVGAADQAPGASVPSVSAAARSRFAAALPVLAADGDGAVRLELFPETILVVDREAIEQPGPGRVVWRGHVRGLEDASYVTLATADGATIGEIAVNNDRYRIHPTAGGYVVEQLANTTYRNELPPLDPGPYDVREQAATVVAQDDGSVIDMMIVYTPAARAAAGGTAAMRATIDASVSNTNNAYASSGVVQRMRLVYSGEIAYTESGSISADLSRLSGTTDGYMDTVHGLRNSVAADDVSLFEVTSEACGVGYLMTTVSTAFASSAFNVTAWNCAAGNLSFAHETGHNFGLQHDVANAGGAGSFAYAFGYRDPGFFRTVMSYACETQGLAPCARVQLFSTPTRTYGGRVAGVAGQSENARVLNNTRVTTANFRSAIPQCSYSISPTAASVGGGPTAASITVNTQPGCPWTTVNNSTFMTVTSGASGTGAGAVTYSVFGNSTVSQRTGTLTVAGQTFTVTQASGCTYSLNASATTAMAFATVGSVTLSTQGGCSWSALSNAPSMLTITSGSNSTTSGVVSFAVSRNTAITQRVGTLTIAGLTFTVTQAGRLTSPGDIDGDGLGDLIVWRPNIGTWFSLTSTSGYSYAAARHQQWGNQAAGDTPLLGDLDGDGASDLIVWRASTGTWFWLTSGTGYNPAAAGMKQWGDSGLGDQPFLADIDGDRKMDLVLWRASTGTWYWLTSTSGYSYASAGTKQWGSLSAGDVAKLADIDGDRKADLLVWRTSTGTWHWLTSSTGYGYAYAGAKQWGSQAAGDTPFVGDLDGDGKTELVVWRAPTGTWFWVTSASGYNYAASQSKQWGNQAAGDQPFLPDLDGDGKADLTVWRGTTGTWFWLTSASGYNSANQMSKQWGSQGVGDLPMSR